MNTAVIYPSYGRPELCIERLRNLKTTCSESNCFVYLGLDIADPKLDEYECLLEEQDFHYLNVIKAFRSQSFVEVINKMATMAFTGIHQHDAVVQCQDDFIFMPAWDKLIELYLPLDKPRALWFNDGTSRRLDVGTILNRKLWEQRGYVYEPSFENLYCDNYWTEQNIKEGVYEHARFITLLHDHPLHKGVAIEQLDATYKRHNTGENYRKQGEHFAKMLAQLKA